MQLLLLIPAIFSINTRFFHISHLTLQRYKIFIIYTSFLRKTFEVLKFGAASTELSLLKLCRVATNFDEVRMRSSEHNLKSLSVYQYIISISHYSLSLPNTYLIFIYIIIYINIIYILNLFPSASKYQNTKWYTDILINWYTIHTDSVDYLAYDICLFSYNSWRFYWFWLQKFWKYEIFLLSLQYQIAKT